MSVAASVALAKNTFLSPRIVIGARKLAILHHSSRINSVIIFELYLENVPKKHKSCKQMLNPGHVLEPNWNPLYGMFPTLLSHKRTFGL